MLSKNDFLNFTVGLVILTIVFHYLLSLPIEKSLVIAVILSLIFDTAYILDKKVLKRTLKRERADLKLIRRNKVLLIMLTLVSLIYGTLDIHHILVLPLVNSFLIAVILTILVDSTTLPMLKGGNPKEGRFTRLGNFFWNRFSLS